MKRPLPRSWPKAIVEIPTSRPDSRADPQATQKITREQLDEALKRTKSGTRRSVRFNDEDDDDLDGPRDDSPQITITRIDSVELAVFDPSSLPDTAAADPPPTPLAPFATAVSRARAPERSRTRAITPRTAFIAGIAVSMFVLLAAFVGFFAGRGVGGPKANESPRTTKSAK